MKVKDTCVTSTISSCGKLWPGFDVATRSLRQCYVRGKAYHMQRSFVEATTWGR